MRNRALGLARSSVLAALAACASVAGGEPDGPSRPNVVFVLADDFGIGDPGCYNPASKTPTPNIDRIAREGVRLTDMHSPSAVCTPTRYGVLTGRYSWRSRLKSGVLNGTSPHLIEPQRPTVASFLRSHGYATACVGKWHLGLGDGDRTDYDAPLRPGPLDVGFDRFFGIPASLDMVPYVFVDGDRPEEQPTAEVAASKHRRQDGGGFWRGGAIAPSFRHEDVLPRITSEAVAWIDRAAAGDEPFFLYLPLTAPHTPWLPTAEFQGRTEVGHYGDFVTMVDAAVGEVLDALERGGVADDTLVVFTSDNGSHWPDPDIERWGHDANLGYRGQKADVWEGGHRVPFVARCPGRIPAGSELAHLGSLTDLFATLAGALNAPLPDAGAEDSFDLWPALCGGTTPARASAVQHSANGTFALRSGPWKLIAGLGSGGFTAPRKVEPEEGGPVGQLYNLETDRAETHNLWKERPDVVAELGALLDSARESGRTRP
ncbi:MAG: arylsulfatase [Planctomycetota bacterium]